MHESSNMVGESAVADNNCTPTVQYKRRPAGSKSPRHLMCIAKSQNFWVVLCGGAAGTESKAWFGEV